MTEAGSATSSIVLAAASAGKHEYKGQPPEPGNAHHHQNELTPLVSAPCRIPRKRVGRIRSDVKRRAVKKLLTELNAGASK